LIVEHGRFFDGCGGKKESPAWGRAKEFVGCQENRAAKTERYFISVSTP
jgi:hypothetical protein